MMINRQKQYLSYLLRLWQEQNSDPPLWRASLEKPQAGSILGFASLEDLFAYLENETKSSSQGSQSQRDEKN
jgi:hypothetical protein